VSNTANKTYAGHASVSSSLFQPLRLVTSPNEKQLESIFDERTTQYQLHKKHCPDLGLLKDENDEHCYHSSVWSADEKIILAAARIIPLSDTIRSESEQFTEWPDWFPNANDCVDVARLFIVSSGKNMKTVECLFRGIVISALNEDKRYITGSCTKHFVTFYKNALNAHFSDDGFVHGNVGGSKHFMFYVNMNDLLFLSPVKFHYWIQLWPKSALLYSRHTAPKLSANRLVLHLFKGSQYVINTASTIYLKNRKSKKIM